MFRSPSNVCPFTFVKDVKLWMDDDDGGCVCVCKCGRHHPITAYCLQDILLLEI